MSDQSQPHSFVSDAVLRIQTALDQHGVALDDVQAAIAARAAHWDQRDLRRAALVVQDTRDALAQAREIVAASISWTGPADWREQQLERIDELLARIDTT